MEPAAASPASGPRAAKPLLIATLAIAALALVPALVRSGGLKTPFDAQPIADLEAAQPDYIFVGNSILGTMLDPERLRAALPGRKIEFILHGGGMSLVYYLTLKNWIIPSGVRPRGVFLIYTDRLLTEPTAKVSGMYSRRIEELSSDAEPEVEAILAKRLSWEEQLSRKLDSLYPLRRLSPKAQSVLQRIALIPLLPDDLGYLVRRLWVSYKDSANYLNYVARTTYLEKLNSLFGFEQRRVHAVAGEYAELASAPAAPGPSFEERAQETFLPLMLKLAREHDIPLRLIRAQTRPGEDGVFRRSDADREYQRELTLLAEAAGARVYDFSGDPDWRLEHYGSGSHIAETAKSYTTDLFLKRIPREWLR